METAWKCLISAGILKLLQNIQLEFRLPSVLCHC